MMNNNESPMQDGLEEQLKLDRIQREEEQAAQAALLAAQEQNDNPGLSAAATPAPIDTATDPEPETGERPGFIAAAAPVPDEVDHNIAAEPATPSLVSEEDNNACLAHLAKILELTEIQHRALLRNLTLVSDHQLNLLDGREAAIVKTTDNTAIAAKGLLQFQDKGFVKASDALEGAIMTLNDKASYPNGVKLEGGPRDRYMLMLAAQKVGLTITNPVKVEDLDPEVRRDVEAEFFLHLTLNKDALQAFDAGPHDAPAETAPVGENHDAEPPAALNGPKPKRPGDTTRSYSYFP